MTESAKSVSEEFDDLARALRQGPGREIREEAAADEELTELQRRRRLTMAEAARDAMHRGDRVTASAAGLSLTHPLIAVGHDYLTMDDGDRVIDIRLADAVVTVTARSSGGMSSRPAAATFRARLAELEQEGASVEVMTRDGAGATGRIDLVASDHLVVEDQGGPRFYLPLAAVAVVFSRFPPRRD